MYFSIRSSSSKNDQKAAWLNRAGDLLDLSSGDSRDNTPNNVEGVFNQQQHQQGGEQGNLKRFENINWIL